MNIFSDLGTWRFWRHFLLHFFACGGLISTILQTSIIFFPKLAESIEGCISFVGTILFCLIYGLFTAWPRPIQTEYSSPNTKIKVIKGDLLDQDGHLVIGVCDTFDTQIPNIISTKSLLGQAISKIYGSDVNRLDTLLEKELQTKNQIGNINKPGKTKKFEIGTIAVIKQDPRLIFFLAYCEMSETNEAYGTVDGVWKSLISLWNVLSINGNHGTISIPIIGGGLARMSSTFPAQDSIRLIALSYMFESRKRKISDELRIIVRPEDFNRLDRMEIQSFLDSLRAS